MKINPIEQKLVKACILGDGIAQYRLYNRYCKAMYNVCYRIVKKKEDAEDALQDAFVDVFRKLDTFRFESTLGAWIKRIVVNSSLNTLKKRKDVLSLDMGMEKHAEETNQGEDPKWSVDKVKAAILDLPDGYRVVCTLYLLEGFDHQEIADFLGITVSTSKTQLHRAKIAIKKKLKHG